MTRLHPNTETITKSPKATEKQFGLSSRCQAGRIPTSYVCMANEVGMLLYMGRGCSSVGRASDRHAAEAGSISRCGEGVFSQRQLSIQTLLRCPYNPRVQSHALTSVCTLKIPSNSSHTFVWTQENTVRTVRNG